MVWFECDSCGSRLTGPVEKLMDETALRNPESLTMEDYGEDYIPVGYFSVGTPAHNPREREIGHFILNNDDATGVSRTEDPDCTHGCCGLDGLDGPNVLCENGHEVGLKRSDCWTLHYVALDPRWVNERGD